MFLKIRDTIMEDLKEKIESFEGDKRSKEYKELKNQLKELQAEETKPPYPTFYYKEIMSWKGRILDGDKFFKMYNETFDKNETVCNCPGKIRKMVIQMKKIYQKWERERKE